MRIVMFYHSLVSDWNHGNAHFLRGIVTELMARGHEVSVYEPSNSWSLQNLIALHGEASLQEFTSTFPHLSTNFYSLDHLDIDEVFEDTDLVIVHEWNDPKLIELVGTFRRNWGDFTLFFHDTHHRLVNQDWLGFNLDDYDGVLAYGEVIANRYLERGWVGHAWTWHEAADIRVFKPMPEIERSNSVVWIGNWGDGERSEELHRFFIEPVQTLHASAQAYGVRYPDEAQLTLKQAGIEYCDWLPNYKVPQVLARSAVTLHIPRRPYVHSLPGIPTIRPFEALACGIPLVCSPWYDTEGLFRAGHDYLVANDTEEMTSAIHSVLNDRDLAHQLANNGLETILGRHTCAHRVDELLSITKEVGPSLENALAI